MSRRESGHSRLAWVGLDGVGTSGLKIAAFALGVRCRSVHWRFRVLMDDFPTGDGLTEEAVWYWCLGVHQAVCGLVGRSEPCENMQYVRQRMAFSVDIQPKRRLRERELLGELRSITRVALNTAAFLEQEDKMAIRVVDLHPWVAEPAEPLFDDGHYRQAILAAAQNLEVRWRDCSRRARSRCPT